MAISLTIELVNQSTSNTVYAYVTGQAINSNNALFLLQADGVTPYFPTSPTSTGTALTVDCGIPLGDVGTTATITIPQLAGARLWFSMDSTLTFLLNPGPGLVEPAVSNPADPNIDKSWDFCEFTFNSVQLFANITYVDFVCLPISLTLTDTSGATQYVSGMSSSGLDTVCSGLMAQNAIDGAGWDKLIVQNSSGQNLRALSPNNGLVMDSSLFSNYWNSYVKQVWNSYSSKTLSVDTQASYGTVTGAVKNGVFTFAKGITFASPSARDIFSCSTGPFADTSGERGTIVPRLAAGFNRSTLLVSNNVPDVAVSEYYQDTITNHYSRIVHAANLDGKGYAFPYDDVTPTNGANQAGTVSSGNVSVFRVAVGGVGATATAPTTSAAVKESSRGGKKTEGGGGAQKNLGQTTNHETTQTRTRDGEKSPLLRSIRNKFQGVLHRRASKSP